MPAFGADIAGIAILAIFPVCMIFATFFDLFTMTIPNRINLVLLGAFVVLAPLAGMSFSVIGTHVAVAVAVLVVGFGLFSFGVMGGGDAKLLATSALWLGPEPTVGYLLIVGLLGGALTLFILAMRARPLPVMLMGQDWLVRLHHPKEGVPYGIALGPAALYMFTATPWFNHALNATLTA